MTATSFPMMPINAAPDTAAHYSDQARLALWPEMVKALDSVVNYKTLTRKESMVKARALLTRAQEIK